MAAFSMTRRPFLSSVKDKHNHGRRVYATSLLGYPSTKRHAALSCDWLQDLRLLKYPLRHRKNGLIKLLVISDSSQAATRSVFTFDLYVQKCHRIFLMSLHR